jgi:hypothetical protein
MEHHKSSTQNSSKTYSYKPVTEPVCISKKVSSFVYKNKADAQKLSLKSLPLCEAKWAVFCK